MSGMMAADKLEPFFRSNFSFELTKFEDTTLPNSTLLEFSTPISTLAECPSWISSTTDGARRT